MWASVSFPSSDYNHRCCGCQFGLCFSRMCFNWFSVEVLLVSLVMLLNGVLAFDVFLRVFEFSACTSRAGIAAGLWGPRGLGPPFPRLSFHSRPRRSTRRLPPRTLARSSLWPAAPPGDRNWGRPQNLQQFAASPILVVRADRAGTARSLGARLPG